MQVNTTTVYLAEELNWAFISFADTVQRHNQSLKMINLSFVFSFHCNAKTTNLFNDQLYSIITNIIQYNRKTK